MLARLMEYTTYLGKVREAGNVGRTAWNQAVETLLLLMAPAAPHIAEELWQRTGSRVQRAPAVLARSRRRRWRSRRRSRWSVQVNGKVRDKFDDVPVDIGEAEAREMALAMPRVQRGEQVDGKEIDARAVRAAPAGEHRRERMRLQYTAD